MSEHRSNRGYTLIELLVGMAISAIVVAGLTSAGLALQRRASFEEQTMVAQNGGRAAKDLLANEIQHAGEGLGNARINAGNGTFENAIRVVTDDAFAAPIDPTFTPPPVVYANSGAPRISDSIHVTYGRAASMVELGGCNGGGDMRNGANACTVTDPSLRLRQNTTVMFVNPITGVACEHFITQFPSNDKIQTNPGRNNNPPPSSEPCEEADPNFWTTPGAYAMEIAFASFRVNWTGGEPVLEYDDDGPGGNPYRAISREVERLKVRLGVVDLTNPANVRWFPGPANNPPPIDQCTVVTCPDAVIPGGTDALDLPAFTQVDKLMRRVRLVELTLIARSVRSDQESIRQLGPNFDLDGEGNPRDGFKRRAWVATLMPRNYALVGPGIAP